MSLFDGYAVNQDITSVLKIYPNFLQLIKFDEPYIARRYDYDPLNPNQKKKKTKIIDEEESEKNSLRRAKTAVMDIALCNDFDLFPTFTFATNRFDVDSVKRRMAFWLNNQRIIHGSFRYVLVSEYHKDGKAIHFHGLFGGYKGRLMDSSKRTKKGQIIYNIKSYQSGWNTGVQINPLEEDKEKVAGYITKYITKEMPKFRNKQKYWCSNGLKRPLKVINPLFTAKDLALFESTFRGRGKEIFQMRGEMNDADILRIADYGKRREDDLWVSE